MGRPSKSTAVTIAEGKSHRTKSEIAQRAAAEAAVLSGITIRMRPDVARDPVAMAEFERVIELLTAVNNNDAVFEATINDYAMYYSDINRANKLRERLEKTLEKVETEAEQGDCDAASVYNITAQLYKQIADCNKQVLTLRKRRFDLEKENGLTLMSAMRAIPKKVAKDSNPLLDALAD